MWEDYRLRGEPTSKIFTSSTRDTEAEVSWKDADSRASMCWGLLMVACAAGSEGVEYVDHYRRCLSSLRAEKFDSDCAFAHSCLSGISVSANIRVPCGVRWLSFSLTTVMESILGLRNVKEYTRFPMPSPLSVSFLTQTQDKRLSSFCPRLYLSTNFLDMLLSSSQNYQDDKSNKFEKCLIRAYLSTVGSPNTFNVRGNLPILLRLLGESGVVTQRDTLSVDDGWSSELLTILGREDLSYGRTKVRNSVTLLQLA